MFFQEILSPCQEVNMRHIFIPYELTPLYLANFAEVSPTFKRLLPTGEYPPFEPSITLEDALSMSEQALSVARRRHRKESEALIHLCQADLLWRLGRWEESLDTTRRAIRKFELEIGHTASYNQALAVYFKGILYYILHTDEKAIQTFIHAQEMLRENELDWSYGGEDEYAENCQDVALWISQLLQLRTQSPPGADVMIVPVYEYEDQRQRATISALVVPLSIMYLPPQLLGTCAALGWLPLEIDTVPLLRVSPGSYYFARKIKQDKELVPESRAGDTVLFELLLSTALTAEELRNANQPFVRRPDGKVVFEPLRQNTERFIGVPRVLLRGGA